MKDFGVEYAKSGRAACCGCQQKIARDDLRIKKVVFDTEVGMKYGGQPLWHHVDCFVQLRNDLGFFAGGDVLPGYKDLEKEDQAIIKNKLKQIKVEDIPEAKRIKLEKKEDEEEQKENKILMQQNKLFFKYKTELEANLKKPQLIEILEKNHQRIPPGKERVGYSNFKLWIHVFQYI